jgi:hypothetical protein
MPGQHGRTVLVTGANSGIGFQAAPAAAVDLVALDLADLDSVARLADQILGHDAGLDLLINNAGVMAVPGRQVTVQGFELQFGTNHLGHFALSLRLLPVLLARPGSRVVTVSSLVHRFGSIRLDDLPVLRAATDPRVRGGDYYGPRGPGGGMGAPRKVRYARTARDEQLACRLWQVSEALTGVTFPGLTRHPPALPAGAPRTEHGPGQDADDRQQQPGGEQDVHSEAEDGQGHDGDEDKGDDGEHGNRSPVLAQWSC